MKKESPLQKPEDLKGKTLGVYSLATGSVTLVRIALWKKLRLQRRGERRRLHDEADADGGDARGARNWSDRRLDAGEHPSLSAGKSGDFRSLISTDRINIELFGSRPVAAVFIGYNEKLAAKRDVYRAAMILLRDFAQLCPVPSRRGLSGGRRIGENVDEQFLRVWEDEYQGFPVSIDDKDIAAIDKLWLWSKELGILPETRARRQDDLGRRAA